MTKKEVQKIVVCELSSHVLLTKGKEYEVINENDKKIFVIDDSGKKNSFYKARFK